MKRRPYFCTCASAPPMAKGDFGATEIEVQEASAQVPGASHEDASADKKENPRR